MTQSNSLFPVGTILPLASESLPLGWLLCDGAEYDTEFYKELQQALKGSKYLPDLKERALIGNGGGYNLFDVGGEKEVTLTIDQIPAHNHSFSYTQFDGNSVEAGDGNQHSPNFTAFPNKDTTTGDQGGGKSHSNMQPYYVVNFIIYTGK